MTSAGSETLTNDPANGLLAGTTLGAVSDSYGYSQFAEMSSYSATSNATPVFATSFIRDKLGRIIQKTETVNAVTHVYDYTYDMAGRLETVSKDAVLQNTYTYDDNSNRENNSAVYDDQDRLTSTASATYTYTDNGELLTKVEGADTTSYVYDVLGNLTQVTLPNGDVIDYVIDGRNRRVGKKRNGVLEAQWLYKDQLNPIAELDGTGALVSRFVYASRANVPDYIEKGGVTYRVISDHLGSPRFVIDTSNGSTAQELDYDEWGNILFDTNPGFQPFGFNGGLADQDTMFVKFGARDYDPQVGRWNSKDPIKFLGGDPNLFSYVFVDPINFSDPMGLIRIKGAHNEPITVHKNDPDPFPSKPHGHFSKRGKQFKVDAHTGEIYDGTRNTGEKLSKKGLENLRKALKKAGFIGFGAGTIVGFMDGTANAGDILDPLFFLKGDDLLTDEEAARIQRETILNQCEPPRTNN